MSLWHFFTSSPFGAGANVLQYIGSAGMLGMIYHYWHNRCQNPRCIRPGSVPKKGTVHKVCKKHAKQGGHTH